MGLILQGEGLVMKGLIYMRKRDIALPRQVLDKTPGNGRKDRRRDALTLPLEHYSN